MSCGAIKFNKQIYSFIKYMLISIIYMSIEKKESYSNTILKYLSKYVNICKYSSIIK